MPLYTIVITGTSDGHQHTTTADFTTEAAAISETDHLLTPEHTSVAIARGVGEDIEFIGAWDWCDGQPRWTAEND